MSGSPLGGSHMTPRPTAAAKPRPFGLDLVEHGRVGLLQVQVGDAVGVVADQRDVVSPVVGDVAGVEAQVDVGRVGLGQEPLDLRLGADKAVGVRVEHRRQAVLVSENAAQLGGPVDQGPPLVAVQLRGVGAGVGGEQHHVAGAHGRDQLGHLVGVAQVGLPAPRVVQDAKHGWPDTASPRRSTSSRSRAGSVGR